MSGTIPPPQSIPPCDSLIINAGKQNYLPHFLKNVQEFTIEISDCSHFYEVTNCFNSTAPDNTVGIDHTAMDTACQYLKNNYTVFSKTTKPLSQYGVLPPVIITKSPELYPSRPSLPESLFLPGISLGDIYSVSSQVNAENIIAYCPDYNGERKRGNLIITGESAVHYI